MKKYWLEILVFIAIGGILLTCLSPNITWMNTDSDGAHYIFAAKYLTTAHHMSAPLYLLLGHLFLKIPIGADAWRMGLMSVFGTMGSVIFIYLILRHLLRDNPKARLYAIISCLVFGGSALIISQSIIVETMTLAMMCGLGAYYFTLKKKWVIASVMLGLGLAIHPFLAFIVWVVLFIANREMRNWRRYMITIAFFAFYLYIPIVAAVNPSDNMWGNETASGFFGGTFGMVMMLVGGLSMWDFPKRAIDTLLILLVSFGLGIVPLIWHFIKAKRWRNSLLWLVLIPIIFFVTNLSAQTCFPKSTTVLVKKRIRGKGNKYLSCPIATPIEKIKVGDEALSYNIKTGIKEYKPVTRLFSRRTRQIITLQLSNGNELCCTPNHPIAVNKNGQIKWKRANKIEQGDELIQYKYRSLGGRIYSLGLRGKTIKEIYGKKIAKQWSEQSTRNAYNSWNNPNSGLNSPEHHKRISIGNRKAWRNPDSGHYSERRKLLRSEHMKIHNPFDDIDSRKKLSETRKKQWANKKYASKMFESWNREPNKSEIKLLGILNEICPNEFHYNGDAREGVVFGRRIPDFVDVNGKKKIVELYGDYWHKGDDPEILKEHYSKYGFDCLVVWERELKDEDSLKKKLINYVYNPKVEIVKVISITSRSGVLEDVYNIEVADNNNYYARGILVHNCVYMIVGVAFGSIAVGLGLSKLNWRWSLATCLIAIGLLGYNANYFDIGRTLDPEMSAEKFYYEELAKIPEGEYFMGGGWTWAMVYLYNREEGRNIIPISVDALPNKNYWAVLDRMGIKYDRFLLPLDSDMTYLTTQGKLALSIARMNDGVWIAKETKPEVYQYVIEPAEGNEDYIGRWIGQEVQPEWRWQPSNPYLFISGQLEIREWNLILQSNKNMLVVISFGVYGYGLYFLLARIWKKKHKAKLLKTGTEGKGI